MIQAPHVISIDTVEGEVFLEPGKNENPRVPLGLVWNYSREVIGVLYYTAC